MEHNLKNVRILDHTGFVTMSHCPCQYNAHAQQILEWTGIVHWCEHTTYQTDQPHAHTYMHAHMHTHSSFSLLAPQAVSHPSIHVTKRWVHPVTGQLVAVRLIYVAPLSSLFLLWWRDYVCLLPIRKVYSAHNGGPVRELSQLGKG